MNRAAQTFMAGMVALCLFAGGTAAWAQRYIYENQDQDPRWATLYIDRVSVGIFAEAFSQKSTASGSDSYQQTRTFLGPLVGMDLSGSIYHPNLMTYRLTLDGSLGLAQDNYSFGSTSSSTKENRFIGIFSGEMQVFDSKPFHGRLYSSYTHTYQDYDFFNRIYVDTWRYGGGVYYSTGPWNFAANAYRVTDDATGNLYPRTSDTRMLSFDVSHRRTAGTTALSASVSDFTRNDSGLVSSGQDYLLALSDVEDFGARKQYHSLVNLGYNHLETMSTPADLYTIGGSLRVDHTEHLLSQHQVNYSHNSFGSSLNDTLNGSSSLQHQLFDSLTSSLTVQGYRYSNITGPNSQDSWQLGIGPGVNYVKRLSDSSSLSAYESIGFFHTEVESSGGILQVTGEPHTFGIGAGPDFFSLRQPNVVESSINITGTPNNSGTNYIRGIDYEVVPNGQLTLIQRLPGSTMPNSVYAHYEYYASPSGSYDTLNNACGIRLDFFNNLWSIYARLNINQNSGDANMIVQDLNDFIVGSEVNWRFLRAGAEYERYDSSLSPYNTFRLFQNLTFRPKDYSTISLNFSESYVSFESAGRSEQHYRAILRYNRRLTRHLGLTLEVGANQRIGEGVDQTLAVFRPELQYVAGSFSAAAGYDFGYDEYLNGQKNLRNRAFVRLRKEF